MRTTTIATQPVFGGTTYIDGGVDTTIIASPSYFDGGCDTIIESQPTYGGTTYIEDFSGGGVDTTIITSDYGDCGTGGDYSVDYSCDY